jgi:RNA polymerase sigma-70 factor, ECF subfamily
VHATVVLDEARRVPVTTPEGNTPAEDVCSANAAGAHRARTTESAELYNTMARVANGDADAFAELYDRTSARVHGMVLRVLRDPGVRGGDDAGSLPPGVAHRVEFRSGPRLRPVR